MSSRRLHLISASALMVLATTSAGAQDAHHSNARWQAWYGCWAAEPRDSAGALTSPRTVCLTPTHNPDVVEVVAAAQGSVVHRDTIDASGALHEVDAEGCKGNQSAQWSADGRRVFVKALTSCTGAVTKTTAVLAMTPYGEWLDIRSVVAPGASVVNVARYREVGFSQNIPSEIIEAVRGYAPNIDAARLASGAPVPASAVIEASKLVDDKVLEAWVAQTGLAFVTDATSLRELADAGVSPEITDAMVTVEANSRDVYDRSVGAYGRQASDYWDQGTGMRVWFTETDPWGYGLGGAWRYGHSYQRYAFGTNNWGWLRGVTGWGNGVNTPWSGFASADNTVGSLLPPTIVLHNNPTNTEARGRAAKADNADNGSDAPAKGLIEKAIEKAIGSSSSNTGAPRPSGSAKPKPR